MTTSILGKEQDKIETCMLCEASGKRRYYTHEEYSIGTQIDVDRWLPQYTLSGWLCPHCAAEQALEALLDNKLREENDIE